MSISNFEIISKLGEGAFSSVFKVTRKSDQQTYALKKVKLTDLKQKEKENSLNEVRFLASISHPNIIGYKEAFIDEKANTLCIVMELADQGDLLSKITKNKAKFYNFRETEIWNALVQITNGLMHLHDLQILHRDLKGANIFISKEGIMKLGDLNVSKVNKRRFAYTPTGTPLYASPEVWQHKAYDWRSDIWSLGCVIYEMAALKPPFTAHDMKGLYNKVVSGVYPRISVMYSDGLASVIDSMLQVNPKARPSCKEILARPEVIKNKKCKLYKDANQSSDILETIKLESDIKDINRKMPAAQYECTNDSQKMDPKIEEIGPKANQMQLNPQKKKGKEIQNPRII